MSVDNILKNFSDNELQKELERRKDLKGIKPLTTDSIQAIGLNYGEIRSLIRACENYINGIAADGYADEDGQQWIYEAALEVVYGDKIWEWINEREEMNVLCECDNWCDASVEMLIDEYAEISSKNYIVVVTTCKYGADPGDELIEDRGDYKIYNPVDARWEVDE